MAVANGTRSFPRDVDLKISVEKQEQRSWCWASVGVALEFLWTKQKSSQTSVASRVLQLDCAANADVCDMTISMSAVLLTLKIAYGESGVVAWEKLVEALAKGFPISLRGVRSDGTPHFILLTGYVRDRYALRVADPADGSVGEVSFGDLLRGQTRQLGTWTHTFWTKARGDA